MRGWGFTHGECEKILDKAREWVILQKMDDVEYLNEE
jgi:hypothetical protein